MARQQPDFQSNGRQGELQVQRAADMSSRETESRDMATRDTAVRERSLGELFRDLTTETSELVSKEIALVKAEARQTGSTLAKDGAKIGIASALALVGSLALTAFLIVGLGDLLNGKYWLSALIVGVVFLAIGAMMVKNATADIKRRGQSVKHTVDVVKDTGAWAKQEARQVKQELTS
ncbi:MAG: phage holin family protein [Gemmatimonadota bacterium]